MSGCGGYLVSMDPGNFSRFPSYDPRLEDALSLQDLEALDTQALEEEMVRLLESEANRARVEGFLDRIPAKEADIIELYFYHDKRQADIASIFDITQAAVSYRLGRGIMRLQFLLDIPDVSRDQMVRDLSKAFPGRPVLPAELEEDPEADVHIDVRILVAIWESTCQSEVAKTLKLTQGRVRHRFFRAVERLKELAASDKDLEPYAIIFNKLATKKFNILREVQLPQWAGRGCDEIA